MELLEIKNLNKVFDNKKILDDINLKIPKVRYLKVKKYILKKMLKLVKKIIKK